jgi:hypothetical protein
MRSLRAVVNNASHKHAWRSWANWVSVDFTWVNSISRWIIRHYPVLCVCVFLCACANKSSPYYWLVWANHLSVFSCWGKNKHIYVKLCGGGGDDDDGGGVGRSYLEWSRLRLTQLVCSVAQHCAGEVAHNWNWAWTSATHSPLAGSFIIRLHSRSVTHWLTQLPTHAINQSLARLCTCLVSL